MHVVVASLNPTKIRAVGRALDQRPDLPFSRSQILGLTSTSGVPEQPTGAETARGAVNRVQTLRAVGRESYLRNDRPIEEWAADNADVLYIGIESGLFMLGGDPEAGHEFVPPQVMDYCVVFAMIGDQYAFGTSSGFALPDSLGSKFAEGGQFNPPVEKYTLDDAAKEVGLTANPRVGYDVGIVCLLSGGRLSREDYTFEAVRNALFGLFPPK